jgi:hypothetical protein
LLDFPAPQLAAYHMVTVVAEKLDAMLKLGTLNTRTKDYYDLLVLSRAFAFDGQELASAFHATFSARGTALPAAIPDGLSDDFGAEANARNRWIAFLTRNALPADTTWPQAIRLLRNFLLLPLRSAGREFRQSWPPGGPWQA